MVLIFFLFSKICNPLHTNTHKENSVEQIFFRCQNNSQEVMQAVCPKPHTLKKVFCSDEAKLFSFGHVKHSVVENHHILLQVCDG